MEEKKMEMIKFNEQEKIDSVNGALALYALRSTKSLMKSANVDIQTSAG